MKNKVVEAIKDHAVEKLTEAYGYCGAADSDELAMLNSDDGQGNEIRITIKCEVGYNNGELSGAESPLIKGST